MWNVKRCKDEQLFFSALCSFIRKKESIHIFSYMHLAAFCLLAHLSSSRGGTALQQRRLASFQGQKCKLFILHWAVRLLKTSHITAEVIQLLTSVMSWWSGGRRVGMAKSWESLPSRCLGQISLFPKFSLLYRGQGDVLWRVLLKTTKIDRWRASICILSININCLNKSLFLGVLYFLIKKYGINTCNSVYSFLSLSI